MTEPQDDLPFRSEDEQWMTPALRELERLLDELVEASWPPSPWTRHKFETVLVAAESGRFAEAYEGVLWSRDRFNRWRDGLGRPKPAAAEASLEDYRARVDAVRTAASAAASCLEPGDAAAPDIA